MPTVGRFEAPVVALELWRAVEAQHRVATTPLVDTLNEQALLEDILESSKPPLPPTARPLHYLLFTPFRYPPLPRGSRFRGPADPGVFYGADEVRTACAELGYWRWKVLADSPEVGAIPPVQQTLFRAAVAGRTIDLRSRPYAARRKQWTHPGDYSACQALAREARAGGVDIIRYESVRDPQAGGCGAVLTPSAFTHVAPLELQTWSIAVFPHRVVWQRDAVLEDEKMEFETKAWSR